MSGNTQNAIEALAAAQSVTLAGSGTGSDRNALEFIAAETDVVLAYSGNDDNALEALTALLAEEE